MLVRINESGMRPRYKIYAKINSTEEENTKHFNTGMLKYNKNFNMQRSKQIMRKFEKQFIFLLFFKHRKYFVSKKTSNKNVSQ